LSLAHPETVAFGTLQSLANESGVSPGIVLRMLRSLGYGSFSDFKTPFQNALRRVSSNSIGNIE